MTFWLYYRRIEHKLFLVHNQKNICLLISWVEGMQTVVKIVRHFGDSNRMVSQIHGTDHTHDNDFDLPTIHCPTMNLAKASASYLYSLLNPEFSLRTHESRTSISMYL